MAHATQGAAEQSLSDREVIGFGRTASHDSALHGNVLDMAIREAVERPIPRARLGMGCAHLLRPLYGQGTGPLEQLAARGLVLQAKDKVKAVLVEVGRRAILTLCRTDT